MDLNDELVAHVVAGCTGNVFPIKVGSIDVLGAHRHNTAVTYHLCCPDGSYALKVWLASENCNLPQDVRLSMVSREVATHSFMQHPNISRVVQFGNGWMASEWTQNYLGAVLSSLEVLPPLGVGEVIRIGYALTSALGYVHSAKQSFWQGHVVHFDVGPINIVSPRGFPVEGTKLIDLGSAFFEGSYPYSDFIVFHTPFTSPEATTREGVPDRRSDIFSAALTLYTMFMDMQNPFWGVAYTHAELTDEQRELVFSRIRQDVPPSLHSLNPQIPKDISDVVAQAMEKDPARRPYAYGMFGVFAKHV